MSARSERGAFTAAARRAGAARSASIDGVDIALDGLDLLADAMGGEAMAQLIDEQTDIMWQDAKSRVHFGRTGHYLAAIRKKVFQNADSIVGTVFVIQDIWDRAIAVGRKTLWPKNLPLWLEYGTRRADPHAHLIPAFNAARERLNRAVERLLGQSVDPS